MSDKKINVLSQLLCAFQKKRPVCDDIVTAADKVIERYILSKSAFIRKTYKPHYGALPVLMVLSLLAIGGAIVLLIL